MWLIFMHSDSGDWVRVMETLDKQDVTASLSDHRFMGTSQTLHSKFIKYLISVGKTFKQSLHC